MTPVALTPPARSSVLLLFGASGDLATRMLWPSLHHLFSENLLPTGLKMIGSGRSTQTSDAFRQELKSKLHQFGHKKVQTEENIEAFLQQVEYVTIDVNDANAFEALKSFIPDNTELLCYLSTSPSLYTTICHNLHQAGLVKPSTRLILEKPIGHDLKTSLEISNAVGEIFKERQIYRIDHYLGKETVQNLLALRFANCLFEPIWNANTIDHVQITVSETVGLEGRWGYYNDSGALRDMVQNHILQTLALVTMEPPSSLSPDAVRNEKVKVLQSLRPINADNVLKTTVAGQYVAGAYDGKPVPGYLQEDGAVFGSKTETFVAIQAHIDNWRWKGVPFFLMTGKRMETRFTEIIVQFRQVPHNIFEGAENQLKPNRLVIRLQPEETITLELMNKQPGLFGVQLQSVGLNLSLTEAFETPRQRISYERLLLDALHGNSTLFVRRDELEAAWSWIDGIHRAWQEAGIKPKLYAAGTMGPEEAEELKQQSKAHWDD
jgi:glucose-6-phosphate 1-dehydrogenase